MNPWFGRLPRLGDCACKDSNGNSTAVLAIIATFGGKAVGAITRQQIADWVQRMVAAGKSPSTVRHAYFVVRMVPAQAVVDVVDDPDIAAWNSLPGR